MIIEGMTESWLTLVGMAEGGVTALALLSSMGAEDMGTEAGMALEIPDASGGSAGAFDSDFVPHAGMSVAMVATASKRRNE
jgi:hypothetical protein